MTVKEFIDENREDLKKAFAIVGGLFICRILGIRVPISYNDYSANNETKTQIRYIYAPSNYIEEAIKSIAETAIDTSSNYSKEKACKEIYSIFVKNKDAMSDSTKTYAINAMKTIAKKSSSNYTKEIISEMITGLVQK